MEFQWTIIGLLALTGMLAGFAYGLSSGVWVLPHKIGPSRYNPGCLGDCLFGLLGTAVIFSILPLGLENLGDKPANLYFYIRLFGFAALGGWGGKALIDSVLSTTVRQLQQRIDDKDQQEIQDAKTLEMTDQYLNSSTNVSIPQKDLLEAIENASPKTKVEILNEAKAVRSENWKEDKGKMEKTIPIFESLAKATQEVESHRVYGQLGFALKDQSNPDYDGAIKNLDKAIIIRDKANIKGFSWYEFNRAMSKIYSDIGFRKGLPSDKSMQKAVINDFKVAFSDSLVSERLQKSATNNEDRDIQALTDWLDYNAIQPSSVNAGWLTKAA
ncbi:MAG: hypothetical protein AB8B69_24455 [Chitinophagales bacterium]